METYKVVKGFENYSVSDHGNVKNNTTRKILKNCPNVHGYEQVQLWKDQKRSTLKVHRLVALSFLPNLEAKPMVDHIDNNILNNNVSNLRWATRVQNGQNRILNKNNKTGYKGVSFNKRKDKYVSVIQVDGIQVQLGYFTNIEDAKQARIIKANQAFGIYTNSCEKII
jgi:hypothetical protein